LVDAADIQAIQNGNLEGDELLMIGRPLIAWHNGLTLDG
jgi:hypothetical protein